MALGDYIAASIIQNGIDWHISLHANQYWVLDTNLVLAHPTPFASEQAAIEWVRDNR